MEELKIYVHYVDSGCKQIEFIDQNGEFVSAELVMGLLAIGKLKVVAEQEIVDYSQDYVEFGNEFYLTKI